MANTVQDDTSHDEAEAFTRESAKEPEEYTLEQLFEEAFKKARPDNPVKPEPGLNLLSPPSIIRINKYSTRESAGYMEDLYRFFAIPTVIARKLRTYCYDLYLLLVFPITSRLPSHDSVCNGKTY